MAPHRDKIVVLSGYHDYRSRRRVDLHFIADELAKASDVAFVSLRYSRLTRLREDPRHDLWHRANAFETVNGVDCYLWRTPIHPCRLPPAAAWAERALFGLFARHLPAPVRDRLRAADTVLVESGLGLIYLDLIRRLNPGARLVYLASDALDAIGQAGPVKRALRAGAHLIDAVRVPSPLLASEVPPGTPTWFIPHGIAAEAFAARGASPYRAGTVNAVSVGSMLFDPAFFAAAGRCFPEVTFHCIGSGHAGPPAGNVLFHPEMPFSETLPYLQHADFAVAAYGPGVAPYLTHTSMKLMQYDHLGLPAVCPVEVAGVHPGRHGYRRGDAASIRAAVAAARGAGRHAGGVHLSWAEVAARLRDPSAFDDTRIGGPSSRSLLHPRAA
ncbi:hypothetical protein [Lichenibacterium dinghuense]|uniref:GumK N-terminal domain-containing glycosyltransferase n=1 Tax=Lichenibacterium dinghuense TaxID=2895977 RepID=UPI001F3E817B|nr:hypothetical protein [Lichenibacterium sp. 6Y81]